MASTFPLKNSPTATQLSKLKTSGSTKERIWKVLLWRVAIQLSHADSSPRVFSMILSNWLRMVATKWESMKTILPGHLISNTNSQILKTHQEENHTRTFSGTICKMSISLSGWELPVSQISVSFGEEYHKVLMQEITKYTLITSLKYHHSKERNISCYLQPML